MNSNINHLQALAKSGNIQQLATALDSIRQSGQADIEKLFGMFQDSYSDQIVFEVLHVLETLPDREYVNAYLRYLPEVHASSSRWAGILLIRIVNNPQTFTILRERLMNDKSLNEVMSKVKVAARKIKPNLPDF
ncbi:MAG TPA: Imm30 family immunity protein [Chryseosolibacter sp.]